MPLKRATVRSSTVHYILFFAKDIDFIMEYAMVDCILFHGDDRIKILNRRQYKGNIIENIENALSFIQKHTKVEYVITGKPRREEIPDYPEEALREAIVNAVCHRDYFIKQTNVIVEVFRSQVKISNPGGLPKGLDPKVFGTKSFPRNQLIASMLHRADYIEKAGTGIKRMKEAVQNHRKRVEMEIEYSQESIFYDVIFRLVENSPKTQKENLNKQEKTSNFSSLDENLGLAEGLVEGLAENQRKMLELMIQKPSISKQNLADILGISTTAIDKNINLLKKKGLLKRIGHDKGGYWKVLKPKK